MRLFIGYYVKNDKKEPLDSFFIFEQCLKN